MRSWLSRGASVVVAIAYIVAAFIGGDAATSLKLALALMLPLACIWFPDALGQYSGSMRLHPITSNTPAILVSAGGWLLLVVVPVAGYFIQCGRIEPPNAATNREEGPGISPRFLIPNRAAAVSFSVSAERVYRGTEEPRHEQ